MRGAPRPLPSRRATTLRLASGEIGVLLRSPPTPQDATYLRQAARVLVQRSKRPGSWLLAAIVRILLDTAAKIDAEHLAQAASYRDRR